MSPLQLIIKREYLQDVMSRSFWIGTFALPILMIAFGAGVGFLSAQSDTMQDVASMGQHTPKDLNGVQLLGLMAAMFLTIFLMVYGAMIFNKVKAEKTNRIMEMIATTVTGRTMMLGKIIAVALTGLTQLLVWMLLIVVGAVVLLTAIGQPNLLAYMLDGRIWLGLLYAVFFFFGGYLLFGSMYAMVGAMTDKENENQGYIAIMTFILMACVYLASFAIDNPDTSLAVWCSFIPFTSPSLGAMAAISGTLSWWGVLLSLAILYATAWLAVTVAGKVYTSAMLLNGTKFSPRDILVFIRAK